MKKKIFLQTASISVLALFVAANCFAANISEEEPDKACLKEIGILTGYASGDLIAKDDYNLILTIARFGFDLNPFLNKFNIDSRGLVEFILEPFANTVISPDSNVEAGCNFLFKYGFPLTQRIYPYIEGGLGVLFMTQHTLEQSTQYNFLPQAGAGITYFIKKDKLAVNLGYRYRHLSNASFKSPNKGINVNMALVGLSLFY
ncbi:MAG: acyloxyacyl hydrolase [Candidatus Omnitrophica bacterium]|nr:acyloxyacyl hydrolase [Candidatus Omnitrophota bacterium]